MRTSTGTVTMRWVAAALAAVLGVLLGAGPGAAAEVWPGKAWATASPARVGLDPATLDQAVAYGSARGGSGLIVRHGYRVGGWGDPAARYELYSSTKSFGSLVLGLAVKDGKVRLDGPARPLLPSLGVPPRSNLATGWLPLITVEQLATHSAGFAKPGGFRELLFRPGSAWSYSDGGANWLADVLTTRYARDLALVLQERVLTPLQIGPAALVWHGNSFRPPTLDGVPRRTFGMGIAASVDAMARIGLMAARGGRWRDGPILDPAYAAAMGRTPALLAGLQPLDPASYPDAPRHYGLLWWNNGDGTMRDVPRDAFWSWGCARASSSSCPASTWWPPAPGRRAGRRAGRAGTRSSSPSSPSWPGR